MLRYDRQTAWFSRLVRHLARKWSGSILTTLEHARAEREREREEREETGIVGKSVDNIQLIGPPHCKQRCSIVVVDL